MSEYHYTYTRDGDDEHIPFKSLWMCDEPGYVAEDAAESDNSEEDWESDSRVLEVFHEGVNLGVFEVHREYSPDFRAYAVCPTCQGTVDRPKCIRCHHYQCECVPEWWTKPRVKATCADAFHIPTTREDTP